MTNPLNSELHLPCGAVLKNRLAKAAMTEGLADVQDNATEAHENLYRTWANGGSGLLLTGNVMIDRRYLERPGNVVLEDKQGFEQLKRWASAGTENGTHLWMQISHPGRQCSKIVSMHPVSASDVQLQLAGNFAKPRALIEEEIQQAIAGYVRTATIAKEAGFTGVQVHAAHGYLISQFLSPVTNHRTDGWGGSLENRARFLLAVVRGVRNAVGPEFPVSVKLNSADFQKGGFTLEESAQVAEWLGEEKVDLLELSGGTYEQMRLFGHDDPESQEAKAKETIVKGSNVRESTRQREAYFLKYAKAIQQAAKIPLMVTGGFRSRETMTEALAAGELDMIGLGRPLCADPDIPQQLLDNKISQVPSYESKLMLGNGWLGPSSKIPLIKIINVQGEMGWFYRQIIQHSLLKAPVKHWGVLRSFATHLTREYKIAIQRKGEQKKREQRRITT